MQNFRFLIGSAGAGTALCRAHLHSRHLCERLNLESFRRELLEKTLGPPKVAPTAKQRLLSTAMFAFWAALGQEADAQIKLLEEYFGAQLYGAAPVCELSGSTPGKSGARGPSHLLST